MRKDGRTSRPARCRGAVDLADAERLHEALGNALIAEPVDQEIADSSDGASSGIRLMPRNSGFHGMQDRVSP